ncbi:MAG: bifunctional proline dehydrogenase/L-glutamate gamma-semialdehyde dehydrogenase, partial [Pseudomonadota bacterium]
RPPPAPAAPAAASAAPALPAAAAARPATAAELDAALARLSLPAGGPGEVTSLPGPTGESNRLSCVPRGRVLCLGPTPAAAAAQAAIAAAAGNAVLVACPGAAAADLPQGPGQGPGHGLGQGLGQGPGQTLLDAAVPAEALTALRALDAVAHDGPVEAGRAIRRALAARDGPIVPLLSTAEPTARWRLERHVCIDTTAAGGNASLMAEAEDDWPLP